MSEQDDAVSLDVCYLTTTGRTTGTPHRIEIWFVRVDDTVYLMAGDRDRSDWVRNLMASPHVELELGDRKRATRARVVHEASDEDSVARRLMLDKYARSGSEDLDGWARSSLVVAIDWPSQTSYTSLI